MTKKSKLYVVLILSQTVCTPICTVAPKHIKCDTQAVLESYVSCEIAF
jgi:hypothetical protein